MSSNNKIAVLVLSCDSYSDLWHPFFELFFKYWPDCPYKVYLTTNFKDFNNDRVTTLKSNEKSNWSSELKIVLNKIQENHVIVILEDYFLYDFVDTPWLDSLIEEYYKQNASFIRLGIFPELYNQLRPGKIINKNPDILNLEKGSEYRVDLQIALWKKEFLTDLIKEGEAPWEFELGASQRSNLKNDLVLGLKPIKHVNIVHGPISYECGAVTKGVWMRKAIKIAKENNVKLDLSQRPVETLYRHYRRLVYTSMPFFMRKVIDKVLSLISIKNS
ncbi:MAG: hypothetical protein HKO56_01415 [Bacteroidia bacterium]|nr:hypothetical protein [Bacteroidia bacterium]NNC86011.1 hypothetical protein [Bacteroidia bacterium]NNM15287.1 hypothetical protein [Bacteroidia bacterium]